MMRKVVTKAHLEVFSRIRENLLFWLSEDPAERVGVVEYLRRQLHGSSARLRRSACVGITKVFVPFIGLMANILLFACATTHHGGEVGSLEGTGWTLSILQGKGVVPGKTATAHFENGRIEGADGCNRYGGTYRAVDGGFQVGKDLVSTKMACPGPVMQHAAAFTRALTEAFAYSRDANRLILRDSAGRELAVFEEQRADLAGTSWVVTGYNNGRQAVVSVIKGSALTAVFGSNGKLSGSSGCNDYTASYEVSGKKITIGQAAVTRKMCAEPSGVMEQEAQYLKALERVAVFRLDGNRLELRTSEGALTATLTSAAEFSATRTVPDPDHSAPMTLYCGSQSIVVKNVKDGLRVTIGKETFDMLPVVAASGAKYEASGDPTTTFWSKGDRATVVLRGQPLPECSK